MSTHFNGAHETEEEEGFIDELDHESSKNAQSTHKVIITIVDDSDSTTRRGTSSEVIKNRRNQVCQTCSKVCANTSQLRAHRDEAHGITVLKYRCKYDNCGKNFPNKTALVAHERVHSNERPFECKLCSEAFKQKQHLNQHMSLNHARFRCSIGKCSKYFFEYDVLTEHESNHTDHKPGVFQCKDCLKSFDHCKNLIIHVENHRKHQGNAQEHEGTLQPSGGVNSDEDCNNHVMEMNGMPNDDPTCNREVRIPLQSDADNFSSVHIPQQPQDNEKLNIQNFFGTAQNANHLCDQNQWTEGQRFLRFLLVHNQQQQQKMLQEFI